MGGCPSSQSVAARTMNYDETCGRSHEFWRRGCSNTPEYTSWAGDLIIIREPILKQSEVNDMRGIEIAECTIEKEYTHPECGNATVKPSESAELTVEQTSIRTGSENSFDYAVPKNGDPEQERNWDLDVYQSESDCAVLVDGGDALQQFGNNEVISLCGTVRRNCGLGEPVCSYLDNRSSYPEDADNGLLIAIRTREVDNWEIRYAPKDRSLSAGLMMSDDVTVAFTAAIAELGMTHADVFEFGMI